MQLWESEKEFSDLVQTPRRNFLTERENDLTSRTDTALYKARGEWLFNALCATTCLSSHTSLSQQFNQSAAPTAYHVQWRFTPTIVTVKSPRYLLVYVINGEFLDTLYFHMYHYSVLSSSCATHKPKTWDLSQVKQLCTDTYQAAIL